MLTVMSMNTNAAGYIKRTLVKLFLFITAVTLLSSPYRIKSEEAFAGSPQTIAHDFLDIEKPFGAEQRHYDFVDRLINIAKKRITSKDSYTTKEAVARLLIIQKILKEQGLYFKENFLLSKGIDSKAMDCDSFCALFTAMSEATGLPVVPVYAPNHSFLRFNFNDNSYLNWEPLEAENIQDSYYIKKLNISQISLRKGVYLRSLTRKEFLGVEYNNIGTYLITKKQFKESLNYLNKAIELYPDFSSAWHNRGSAWYALKNINQAFSDLQTANSLDPNSAGTHNSLGDIYFDMKEHEKALEEYQASIRLGPHNYVPYYSMALVLQALGRKKEADEWLQKSREIKEKYGK